MNILVVGGSRNIGYYSALRFLEAGHIVTFLLRNASVFDKDAKIQAFVTSGKAHLVKGDALVQGDVKRAWETSISQVETGSVDLVLFTVGGEPNFNLLKGFVISPPDLSTRCLLNVITTLPQPTPRIIAITSIGTSRSSHAALPLPLKPVYSTLLAAAHRDKIGMERLMAHCAGWEWDPKENGKVPHDILRESWKSTEGLPTQGTVKDILVIRPSVFTDGECLAEKSDGKKYRVSEAELTGYSISRKDVAHFVVDAALNRWTEFAHKRVNISY